MHPRVVGGVGGGAVLVFLGCVGDAVRGRGSDARGHVCFAGDDVDELVLGGDVVVDLDLVGDGRALADVESVSPGELGAFHGGCGCVGVADLGGGGVLDVAGVVQDVGEVVVELGGGQVDVTGVLDGDGVGDLLAGVHAGTGGRVGGLLHMHPRDSLGVLHGVQVDAGVLRVDGHRDRLAREQVSLGGFGLGEGVVAPGQVADLELAGGIVLIVQAVVHDRGGGPIRAD